jgi:DNA-binding CsgD family transcriptional regulator/tetratricopeptide (TPR) repeat protein
VTAYLGGPPWPELDAALARRDLPAALGLAEHSTEVDLAERQLVTGICRSVFHQADLAAEALLHSFRTFCQDRPARAAVSAVFLGRMHYWMHDNPHVANGWFARARTLAAGQPGGVEHVLVALPLPGCDIDDVTALRGNAERSLELARRLGERNLEAKALSDLGTALVSLAAVGEGMTRLDEAMAMVLSGEADSPFVSGDVVCNLLTACGRAGDLARANEWTRVAEDQLGFGIEHGPAYIYAHCRSAMGQILCDAGRWQHAEVTLRLAGTLGARSGPRIDGKARAALAELRVLQGRLADAERLVNDRRGHMDTALPLVSLHLARGEHRDVVGLARQALANMGDDHVRAARLLVMLTEAQLTLADAEAAETSVRRLDQIAADRELPVLAARAALARGMVAQHRGQPGAARAAFEHGLAVLADAHWPLLLAELRLRLGQALAGSDPPAAIAEARAAHLIWERLGSPESARSAALLNQLGLQATSTPRAIDATAALSPREQEVLQRLRTGSSNAEIAADLHNSVRTIEHHVSAILAKLGLRSRAEAAVYAASIETAQPLKAEA